MGKKERIALAIRKVDAHLRFKDIELDGSNLEEVFNDNYRQWFENKSRIIDSKELTISDFVNDEKILLKYRPIPETTNIERKKHLLYVNYLNDKLIPKTKEVESELHTNIFKGNSFEIWQRMFEQFDIKDSSKTDANFMVSVMRERGMIHKSVSNVAIRNWINDTYEVNLLRVEFEPIRAKSNRKRMEIFDTIRGT